jgi:hypothetical protein
MDRRLLENLGVELSPQMDVGEPFLKNGTLARTLAAGHFSAAVKPYINHGDRARFRENERVQDVRWVSVRAAETNGFTLKGAPLSGASDNSVTYLSFWVQSPRSLDNLLIEPNVPKLDFTFESEDAIELFLNGKSVLAHAAVGEKAIASSGLPLQTGWNHFLVRLVHKTGNDIFSARLTSSDPAFLDALHSALQRP